MDESRFRSIRTKDGSESSSMSAVSFGFVATAILILMFIIMAIFEHFMRSDHSSTYDGYSQFQKLAEQASTVDPVTTSDVSVLMPGENQPSHVALAAPFPCRREGIRWPLHL